MDAAGHPLEPGGCWFEVLQEADAACRPALFLDRDGVLIEQVHHLHRPEDVRLLPGAAAAIRAAGDAGWAVVVVSNQSGIGRGLFGWPEFAAAHRRMLSLLAADGARPDAALACPFHPAHPWRKPSPGMLLAAAARLRLDRGRSLIVGDRADDLAAGREAGLGRGMLVLTGYGASERQTAMALRREGYEVEIVEGLSGLTFPDVRPTASARP